MSRLLQTITVQGRVCAAMGSAMYGDVLQLVAGDVEDARLRERSVVRTWGPRGTLHPAG